MSPGRGGYKVPPYSVASEKAVLGAILADPSLLPRVRTLLPDGRPFFRPEHGRLFNALIAIADDGTIGADTDTEGLIQALAAAGHLEKGDGETVLRELADAQIDAKEGLEHGAVVREKAHVRALIDAVSDILHDAYHTRTDFEMLLKEAKQRLTRLGKAAGVTGARRKTSKKKSTRRRSGD